jgi:hypothetical protein
MKVILFTCREGGPADRERVRTEVTKLPDVATYAPLRLRGSTLTVEGAYGVTLHDDAQADRIADAIRRTPGVELVSVHDAEHQHP